MAFDTSLLTDYSWSDIAKAAKHALISAATGGESLTINGRVIQKITPEQAMKLYSYATKMAQAEAADDNAAGIAHLQFDEPT
jgi:hypothetical protein